MKNMDDYYLLSEICNRQLRLESLHKTDNSERKTACRERLSEELKTVRERGLAFALLLMYECLAPDNRNEPITIRGRAASSYIMYLLRLAKYDPVRLGFPAIGFFGTEKERTEPLFVGFNLPDKTKTEAIKKILDYLYIELPDKKQLLQFPVVEFILRTTSRKGNHVTFERQKTIGETLRITVSAENDIGEESESKNVGNTVQEVNITLYTHPDLNRLYRLHGITGKLPPFRSVRDPRILSLFKNAETRGLGCFFDSDYFRKLLSYTRPNSLKDLIKLICLTHGVGDYIVSQIMLLEKGETTLNDVMASKEVIIRYLTSQGISEEDAYDTVKRVFKGEYTEEDWFIQTMPKVRYLFSEAHSAEYAWMALALGYFKVYHFKGFYDVCLKDELPGQDRQCRQERKKRKDRKKELDKLLDEIMELPDDELPFQ